LTATGIHAPPPMLCITYCTAVMHAGNPSGCLRLNEGNRRGSLLLSNGDERLQLSREVSLATLQVYDSLSPGRGLMSLSAGTCAEGSNRPRDNVSLAPRYPRQAFPLDPRPSASFGVSSNLRLGRSPLGSLRLAGKQLRCLVEPKVGSNAPSIQTCWEEPSAPGSLIRSMEAPPRFKVYSLKLVIP